MKASFLTKGVIEQPKSERTRRLLLGLALAFTSLNALAEITTQCLREDIECTKPISSEYVYYYMRGDSSNLRGWLGSISELVDELNSNRPNPNSCTPNPRAEALISEQAMPVCDFRGTGKTLDENGYQVCNWSLSNTQGSKYFDGIYDLEYYKGRCAQPNESYWSIRRSRQISCPDGFDPGIYSNTQEDANAGSAVCFRFRDGEVPSEICNKTDQPCQVSTGAKLRSEQDFTISELALTRNYHSQQLTNKGFGKGWHLPLIIRLSTDGRTDVGGKSYYYFSEGAGTAAKFLKENGVWTLVNGVDRLRYRIFETPTGYRIVNRLNQTYNLDFSGRLISLSDETGSLRQYEYGENDRLTRVSNRYSQTIDFSYASNGLIDTVTAPNGAVFKYEFDQYENLIGVLYPDSTPGNDTDNPRRLYHYENGTFPNHLTGITDENGQRYATFAYDADGKAVESELGITTNPAGQERVELDYQ